MKKIIYATLFCAVMLLLGSCAQGYTSLNPQRMNYSSYNTLEDIQLCYRYDVLLEKGNTKMSKKEKKNNLKLLAVKITNNTSQTIRIGDNAAFYSGNTMVYPLDAISIKSSIRQSVPSYLWYLLFTPLTVTVNNTNTYRVGYLLGPLLTGGNMLRAADSNKKFYDELQIYDIMSQDIKPNETVYGLVGFRGIDYAPLTIKLINHQ